MKYESKAKELANKAQSMYRSESMSVFETTVDGIDVALVPFADVNSMSTLRKLLRRIPGKTFESDQYGVIMVAKGPGGLSSLFMVDPAQDETGVDYWRWPLLVLNGAAEESTLKRSMKTPHANFEDEAVSKASL